MRRRERESGQAMAFMAVVVAAIVLPLMSLAIDASRAMYVRTHLQTAADAACQAGVQAVASQAYQAGGVQALDLTRAASYAFQAFSADTAEAGLRGYQPAITGFSVVNGNALRCEATAQVQTMIGITPPMVVRVEAVSRARASSG